jgi:hypothetical protein
MGNTNKQTRDHINVTMKYVKPHRVFKFHSLITLRSFVQQFFSLGDADGNFQIVSGSAYYFLNNCAESVRLGNHVKS